MRTIIILILIMLTTPNSYNQTTTVNEEKDNIFILIKSLDSWYKQGYIIYWNVTEKWYLKGENNEALKEKYSPEEYNTYVTERIKAVDTLEMFTSTYLQKILPRLDRDDKYNEVMILTNHSFGNMVRAFLVHREHMDGIPAFWPEWNIFMEGNSGMSDSEYIEWHKERITIYNSDKATYKVFYGEIGDSQNSNAGGHGDFHILKIQFIKEMGQWKIEDIEIEEQTEEQATEFYEENVERRGYFNK